MKKQTKINDLRNENYWNQVREFGKRYKQFDWPSVELLLSLIYTHGVAFTHISKLMRSYHLSPAFFNVLMILSQSAGKTRKQNEISKLLLVSRANVTGLVDGMAHSGLVERTSDRNDRRVCLVKITKKAEALLESYLPIHYAEINNILGGLNAKEKMRLTASLRKISNTIQGDPA